MEGRICPRCRFHLESPTLSGSIARCPNDGYALVPVDAFNRADGDPFLGTTVADRFVILGKLGAGSMGTVYRARQQSMARDVAIKILRSDRAFDAHAKARFTREAQAMSLLTSPHTVTVFDFGEIPDKGDELATEGASLYLAMELLQGQSLGERLKREPRLPVEEAIKIARHALLSLAEAHEKGIVHRDLKPDNLFLTRSADGQEICKVLDFGIAKVTSDLGSVDALETQAGTVFGTPRYMSPEQAQGKPLDARSDLYSLGVLLYHMLVGRAPFTDADAVVVMARHIKSTPTPPALAAPDARIGQALSAAVMRALAKDPADRYESAWQFIEELDRALAQPRDAPAITASPEVAAVAVTGDMPALVRDDLEASPVRASPALGRRSRARPILVGAASVLALAVLVSLSALRGGERPAVASKDLAREVRQRLATALAAVASAEAAALPPPALAPPPEPEPTPPPAAASAFASAPATASAATSAASVRAVPPPSQSQPRTPATRSTAPRGPASSQVSKKPPGKKGGSYKRFD